LLAVAGLVTIGVRVGLGLLADAGRADPMRDISALLAVGTVGFLLLASSANIAVTAGAVLGLGVGWGWGGLFVLCAMRRNPDAPGAAVGSAMRGIYAGAVIGPLIGGPLAATSPDVLWYSCAGLAAVGAAIFATQR
jgi:hypothetical protein